MKDQFEDSQITLQGDYFLFKCADGKLFAFPRSRFLTIQATEFEFKFFFKNKTTLPLTVKMKSGVAAQQFLKMFGEFPS